MSILESMLEGMGEDTAKAYLKKKIKGTDIITIVQLYHPETDDITFHSYPSDMLATIKKLGDRNKELAEMVNQSDAALISCDALLKNSKLDILNLRDVISVILNSRKSDLNKIKAIAEVLDNV